MCQDQSGLDNPIRYRLNKDPLRQRMIRLADFYARSTSRRII